MDYLTLSEEEKNEVIVRFYKAQEMDHFVHSLNKERYEQMLPTLPEGDFKNNVQKLLNETNSRLDEVNVILEKTRPQLPVKTDLDATVQTIKAQEGVARGGVA